MSDTQRIYSFISLLLILFTTSTFLSSTANAVVWIPNEATLRDDAQAGSFLHQYELGRRCEKGREPCSPQNYSEAAKWYRLSAEQGYGMAQKRLALLYFKGQGVDQNYEEAYFWLKAKNTIGRKDWNDAEQAALKESFNQLNPSQKTHVGQRIDQFEPKISDGTLAAQARFKLLRNIFLIAEIIVPLTILAVAWLACRKFKPRKSIKIASYSVSLIFSLLIHIALDFIRANVR